MIFIVIIFSISFAIIGWLSFMFFAGRSDLAEPVADTASFTLGGDPIEAATAIRGAVLRNARMEAENGVQAAVVCTGVEPAPDPILFLEDRTNARSHVAYVATLSPGDEGTFTLRVQGARPRLGRMPEDGSRRVCDTLQQALASLPEADPVRWDFAGR